MLFIVRSQGLACALVVLCLVLAASFFPPKSVAADTGLRDVVAGVSAAIDLCDIRALHRLTGGGRLYLDEEIAQQAIACKDASANPRPIELAWEMRNMVGNFIVLSYALKQAQRTAPVIDASGSIAVFKVILYADKKMSLKFARVAGVWHFILV